MILNHNLIIIQILLIVMSCNDRGVTEIELLNKKNPIGNYGKEMSKKEHFEVKDILDSAERYLDNEIIIKGKIIEVCPMRGCWMMIADRSDNDLLIRAKVDDGEIVFPLSAKGNEVTLEGTFTKLEFDEKRARSWKKHLLEEQGIEVEEDEINLVSDDFFEYRVNCSSAKIH